MPRLTERDALNAALSIARIPPIYIGDNLEALREKYSYTVVAMALQAYKDLDEQAAKKLARLPGTPLERFENALNQLEKK